MIKRVKDYIPQITKILNEQEGPYGFQIQESEVNKVLRYYLNNMFKVMKRKHTYLDIKGFVLIRPFLAPLYRQSRKK